MIDAPTKTANRRMIRLDAVTATELEKLRRVRGRYLPY